MTVWQRIPPAMRILVSRDFWRNRRDLPWWTAFRWLWVVLT